MLEGDGVRWELQGKDAVPQHSEWIWHAARRWGAVI